MDNRLPRVKVSAAAGVSRAPAKGRRRRKRKWKARSREGYWFGLLRRAVEEDRDERGERPGLTEEEVLAWADAFFERTGNWPNPWSGPIQETPGETWLLVAAALALGLRGFPPGGSIPRLLEEHRGRYNCADPKFTTEQILAWADDWYARTGDWPYATSGEIPGSGGVNWRIVDEAIRIGRGTLPGGSSLGQLLASARGLIRHEPLTEEKILAWADAHHRRTGQWPNVSSGPITEAPEETWHAVQSALYKGLRGLRGGVSLAELLVARRQIRCKHYAPRLTIPQVLAWADAYRGRTGRWPTCSSGPCLEASGEHWASLISAIKEGHRGLPGGTTFAQLLIKHRGHRSIGHAPPLSIPQIFAWADAFHTRNGKWPTTHSGPVAEAPGETWRGIHCALYRGFRGLPGGTTFTQLLIKHRGYRSKGYAPPLSIPQLLAWADAFHTRNGKWPTRYSGPVAEAPGETWNGIQLALSRGRRGLPGGSSVADLLDQERHGKTPS